MVSVVIRVLSEAALECGWATAWADRPCGWRRSTRFEDYRAECRGSGFDVRRRDWLGGRQKACEW